MSPATVQPDPQPRPGQPPQPAPASPASRAGGELERETVTRLRAAVGKLARRLRITPAGATAGLTPTTISVLFTIARCGPIRLSDLADEEGINPTMLSRIVAGFAEDGLVARTSDPADRRAARVAATAKGERLCERMRRERSDALVVALRGLSDEDRELVQQALPVLEQLAEQLKRPRP